ncbi:uncharacterized protein UV8b_03527 [Ustilaginoidea virens]|uniref:Uncharacterized protein n=1 Tax=Ustilaginoidea virens TaxID=1159556 RepID=A0A8E5HPN2_USTVR|nr:uncharacterized protein UV8b_03527 [Ustilaginoidea virens]QUC19286.1 hypothetical protein UV8b_03527 [Ustilaginoidea virens]
MRIAAAAVAFGALGAAFTPLPPKFFNEPASPWSKPSAPLPIQPSEQDLAGLCDKATNRCHYIKQTEDGKSFQVKVANCNQTCTGAAHACSADEKTNSVTCS